MTQLKPYPKYKDSGVEWIREVPEDWNLLKIKNVAELLNGYSFKSDEYSNTGYPIIRISDVGQEIDWKKTKRINIIDITKYQKFLIKNKDILIAMTGATIGKTSVYNTSEKALLNQRVGVIRAKDNYDETYLAYLINSSIFKSQIQYLSFGGAQENIGTTDIGNIILSFPEKYIQIKIKDYLDYKINEIDSLISDKKQLIELLEEKRQAIITETVTKGLNPNVKMKDSGIEWIGEIPEHWELSKVKYHTNINSKVLSENTPDDFEISYIDIGSVNSKGEILQTEQYKFKNAPSRARRIVQIGDTIVSTVRTYLQAIANITEEHSESIVSTGFAVITPRKAIESKFLGYYFRTVPVLDRIISLSTGVSYPAINAGDLGNMEVLLPSYKEQQKISEYINDKTKEIDITIRNIRIQQNRLKEYRESLIYEAVTGKIDLRSYKGNMNEGEILGQVAEDGVAYTE